MPVFAFKSVDASNRVEDGRWEAATADDVVQHLLQSGQIALAISEAPIGDAARPSFSWSQRLSASPRALTEVLSQTNMLLHSGIPLEKSLALVAASSGKGRTAQLAVGLRTRVNDGQSLSQALQREQETVPPFIVSAMAAGEASGRLEEVVDRLVSYLERSQKIRSDIKGALVYPAILLAMAAISIAILLLVLVPQFKPLFEGNEDRIPTVTRLILAASDYFRPALAVLAAVIVGGGLLLRYSMRSEAQQQRWDRWKLALPFSIGPVMLDIQVAIFTRLLSLLLQNGIPLHHALALTRDAVPNRAIATGIDHARCGVREGRRLSAGLAETKLLPGPVIDHLKVGEEASNLAGVLGRIADLTESKMERSIKHLMDLLVPLLTIGLGLMVAAIIASILLALLSINDLALR